MTLQILVADDSTPIQKVIKIAFSKHQSVILTAASLMEAVKILETESIDLVIADSSLPGSKLSEDFKRLRGPGGQIPVIMLTGSYDSIREVDLKMAGFDSVVKKPFDASDLVSLSEGLIGAKRLAPLSLSPEGLPNIAGLPSSHSEQNEQSTQRVHQQSTTTQSIRMSIPLPPLPSLSSIEEPNNQTSFSISKNDHSKNDSGLDVPSFLLEDAARGLQASASLAEPKSPTSSSRIVDAENKGRPAFQHKADRGEHDADLGASLIPPIQKRNSIEAPKWTKPDESLGSFSLGENENELISKIQSKLRSELKSDLQNELKSLVEQYCREHFKSVAKDVLTQEIRRLADEKAKYLVDH